MRCEVTVGHVRSNEVMHRALIGYVNEERMGTESGVTRGVTVSMSAFLACH